MFLCEPQSQIFLVNPYAYEEMNHPLLRAIRNEFFRLEFSRFLRDPGLSDCLGLNVVAERLRRGSNAGMLTPEAGAETGGETGDEQTKLETSSVHPTIGRSEGKSAVEQLGSSQSSSVLSEEVLVGGVIAAPMEGGGGAVSSGALVSVLPSLAARPGASSDEGRADSTTRTLSTTPPNGTAPGAVPFGGVVAQQTSETPTQSGTGAEDFRFIDPKTLEPKLPTVGGEDEAAPLPPQPYLDEKYVENPTGTEVGNKS